MNDPCKDLRMMREIAENMKLRQFTFDEYQELARRTQNKDLSARQRTEHALFEMASEIGEIHAFFQKEYQGHDIDEKKLEDEVGDLLWGIAEFCDVYGWSMADVAMRNIDKLRKRYPDGFDPERSVHRNE